MSRQDFSLDGLTAIVTGAGSGIGAAIAERFAAHGASVVIVDIDSEAAEAVGRRLRDASGDVSVVTADVSSPGDCRRIWERIEEAEGRCDVLVNNAGVGHVGAILETDIEDFRRLWGVNVESAYHMSRVVLEDMLRRGSGCIINMASVLGLVTMHDRFAYTVTKHALVGLTRSMAFDLADRGVRVNCICPGRVETPFVAELLEQYEDPDVYRSQMVAPHPIGRMAYPAEIAAAAVYLASPAASFVTGSTLVVDGGYTTGK